MENGSYLSPQLAVSTSGVGLCLPSPAAGILGGLNKTNILPSVICSSMLCCLNKKQEVSCILNGSSSSSSSEEATDPTLSEVGAFVVGIPGPWTSYDLRTISVSFSNLEIKPFNLMFRIYAKYSL